MYAVRKFSIQFLLEKLVFDIFVEYANNLGNTKKSNGVDHASTDGASNGNNEDSHKQHLFDLIEKF